MKYRVIKYFTDLEDNRYPYPVDAIYPRTGLKPTKERIAELEGSRNRRGEPLIELVEDDAPAPAAVKKTPGRRGTKGTV